LTGENPGPDPSHQRHTRDTATILPDRGTAEDDSTSYDRVALLVGKGHKDIGVGVDATILPY
jgi:hypothetical protein